MVVGSLAGAASSQGQDPSDTVEELWRDEGLVPAGVFLAAVCDLPEVVAVGQDVVELVER
jgi:hypothetical protein